MVLPLLAKKTEMGKLEISRETRKSCKFYASLILGFVMLLIGCIIEPSGQIHSSVLMAGGMILTIAAGAIGIDLAEIIHQFRLLREGKSVDNIDLDKNEKQNSNDSEV